MNNFLSLLLGQIPWPSFIAAFLFAWLGFTISKIIAYRKGGRKNVHTPAGFNWDYWWNNNRLEFWVNMLFTFLIVRFAPAIVTYAYPDAQAFFERAEPMLMFLVLGYFQTRIVRWATKIKG